MMVYLEAVECQIPVPTSECLRTTHTSKSVQSLPVSARVTDVRCKVLHATAKQDTDSVVQAM